MKYYILMADIVKSSSYDQTEVINVFKSIVKVANDECKNEILSPLTITLGDEFQGVCKSFTGAVSVLQKLKQTLLKMKFPFNMRFVCVYGDIDTKIATDSSYGMLGDGLTKARKLLNNKKRDQKNVQIHVDNGLVEIIFENLFEIMFNIELNSWENKNKTVIYDFVYGRDNSGNYLTDTEIGRRNDKFQSQISRYKVTWDIESYRVALETVDAAMKYVLEPKSGEFTLRLADGE